MYNGYTIKELYFVNAKDINSFSEPEKYGLNSVSGDDYPENVIVILLHLKNPKYADYYMNRFVKMYNVKEASADPSTP